MKQFKPSGEDRLGKGFVARHLRQVLRRNARSQVRMSPKTYVNVRCWGRQPGYAFAGAVVSLDGTPILVDEAVAEGVGVYEEFDALGAVVFVEEFQIPESQHERAWAVAGPFKK